MIVISEFHSTNAWGTLASFAIMVHIIQFIKNLGLITVYIIRRFIDNKDDPPMRPRTSGISLTRVEKEAFMHIQSYLIDPHDDGRDGENNTTVHQEIIKPVTNFRNLYQETMDNPHQLFMLNRFG